MSPKIVIFLTIFFILPLAQTLEEPTCTKMQNAFFICKKNGTLVRVNETINEAGLQIRDSTLSKIAPGAFQDLSIAELKLDLQGNSIELQPGSFEGLIRLDTLVIDSAIISLEPDLFKKLISLGSLTITSCKIKEPKKGAFAGLSKLERLYMNYNNISSVNIETFYGASDSVMFLWLNNNGIVDIEPKSFAVFSSLRRLQLSHNQLDSIKPETFEGLNDLNELFLDHNQLRIIQKNIFNDLKHLTRLDLSHNKINSIEPEAFKGLSLTFLHLNNNTLDVISTGAFSNVSITEINLYHNKIRSVEPDSFRGSRVEYIYFSDGAVTANFRNWGLLESVMFIFH